MNKTASGSKSFLEDFSKVVFIIATAVSIIALGFILYFIFSTAIPTIAEIGFKEFLFGTTWKPTASNPKFGILPFIVGSIYATLGAVILGVPIGVLAAIYMAFYAPKKIYKYLKAGINLLAGIPSVVYGLFAFSTIVLVIRNLTGGQGTSLLAAILVLVIMILPTIISLSEAALRSVPKQYYEASIGMGASKERSIIKVVLPAAKSGVLSSIILGTGRAIGETMAVVMVAGNQPVMPKSLFKGMRTMTANIVNEMSYAGEFHLNALIATGAVLFFFILVINILFNIVKERSS
ncbi:MAG: phosphate ABC transporter permease subunit PstC [Tissierellia bacterium]|nr:phosphate ABC transporter permease subunit PstC [Tissierellia bacterium]